MSRSVPLTRRLSPDDAARIEMEERFHPEAGDWDVALVQRQVRRFHEALRERGVELRSSESVPDMFLAFAHERCRIRGTEFVCCGSSPGRGTRERD